MTHELTETVYNFIHQYITQNRIPPSTRNIAEGCFITLPTVAKYLSILEAQGRIKRTPRQARAIRLIKPGES